METLGDVKFSMGLNLRKGDVWVQILIADELLYLYLSNHVNLYSYSTLRKGDGWHEIIIDTEHLYFKQTPIIDKAGQNLDNLSLTFHILHLISNIKHPRMP